MACTAYHSQTLEFYILQLDLPRWGMSFGGKKSCLHSKVGITRRLHFGMIGSNCLEQCVEKMMGLYSRWFRMGQLQAISGDAVDMKEWGSRSFL